MMDEQLRDNVERLIRRPGDPPSREFLARLEGRLAPRPAPRRAWFPAAVAAAAVLGATSWLIFRAPSPDPGPAQDAGAEFDDPVDSENSWKYVGAALLGARLEEKEGRLRLLLAYQGKETAAWIDADVPATPGNRKAIEAVRAKARQPALVAQLQEAASGALDGKPLSVLWAVNLKDGLPMDLKRRAYEAIQEQLWKGDRALEEDLKRFIETNDYYMLRAINSKATSPHAREAIDLAHRALRGPWRSAVNLAMSRLDDEKVVAETWGPRLRAQNAITLLIEITDRFTESIRPGSADHNAAVRTSWRTWWAEARKRDPSTWCDGLTPAEKADLRDAWLPAIGEVENAETLHPSEPAAAGRALAKRLGLKAAPYLVRMICVDPPRATLWETGTVEFNQAALRLLGEATGVSFGTFDLGQRRPEGRNRVLLWAWKRWAARNLGGLEVRFPGDAEGAKVIARVNKREICRDEVEVAVVAEGLMQDGELESWAGLLRRIEDAFREEMLAQRRIEIPAADVQAERERLLSEAPADRVRRVQALLDLDSGLFDRLIVRPVAVERAVRRNFEGKGTYEAWIRGQKGIEVRILDASLRSLLRNAKGNPFLDHLLEK